MTDMKRIATAALAAALLGACATTTVVREPAGGTTPRQSLGRPGESVVVQRGETLFAIASRNGLTVADLAAWNRLAAPYTIYPGQRLRLHPQTAVAAPVTDPRRASAPRPQGAAGTATRPAAAVKPAEPARPAPPPAAPINSGISWRWPADGALLNRYVAGEPTRQGIDIGGAGGAPVRAAADGTVVYSGAGLVGYGELIIIKHSEAWLSAYGHNRRRLVNEGQLVKAGDQIAEMGRSGAARDMLHFEIRYNGKPVDPQVYLPAR